MTTNQSSEKLALIFIKKLETELPGIKFEILPIIKINDIPVTVKIIRPLWKKHSIVLHIESNFAYIDEGLRDRQEVIMLEKKYEKNDENTLIQFYTESINNIHDTIKNIKFDKMEGKFVEELNNIMEKEFELLFADCSNIKLTWDKCPCCFDETKTKTPCNHPMCIECWGKLELKQEDDDDYYIQICPICKNDMPHFN